ncbi:MAG: nucleotidyltransferase domain-containing protein [Burkholderiales bacterium]
MRSIVLFGSAAEGRMRATSDVNVLVVIERFDPARIDTLRDTARVVRAAVRLEPMFVLADELPLAAAAFAVKFQDIGARHVVLVGADPVATLAIPRSMIVHRVKQVLLNTTIRLRATYTLLSLREEQLARAVADAAAPMRSSAAAILSLEGKPAGSPKEALERVVADLPGSDWAGVLKQVSQAREEGVLPAGVAPALTLKLIELGTLLRHRAERVAT